MRAAIARPVPVLPEVGSTIVPPGFRRPSASAASTILIATRSLIEPPGLKYSTLATTCGVSPAAMRDRRTSGVSPTVSRIESLMSAPAAMRPTYQRPQAAGRPDLPVGHARRGASGRAGIRSGSYGPPSLGGPADEHADAVPRAGRRRRCRRPVARRRARASSSPTARRRTPRAPARRRRARARRRAARAAARASRSTSRSRRMWPACVIASATASATASGSPSRAAARPRRARRTAPRPARGSAGCRRSRPAR